MAFFEGVNGSTIKIGPKCTFVPSDFTIEKKTATFTATYILRLELHNVFASNVKILPTYESVVKTYALKALYKNEHGHFCISINKTCKAVNEPV